jgi:hypothetical protein
MSAADREVHLADALRRRRLRPVNHEGSPAAFTKMCVITAPSHRVLSRGEPEGYGAAAGAAAHPLWIPRRPLLQGLEIERPSHASVTNYADSPGPRCPDLLLRTRPGLTWTPEDGFYNLCHVVPSEGPRIRTGASSGPSKRYCRVFGGVSLTPQTLSRLTTAPITQVVVAQV